MKKVAFHTLGCKLNFSETSTLAKTFINEGYERVDFFEPSDIYVINTCSVTENADNKCRKVVKDALKLSPNAFIAVTGCFAQLKPTAISEIPGVDAVLGASEKFKLLDLIKDFEKKSTSSIYHSEIAEANTFTSAYSINDRTRTFLKVQDGCDYTCTFCTIPLARGKSRSDTISNVLLNARSIVDQGIKEIVLTGVNTGDFGIIDGKRQTTFLELAKKLETVEGLERIRISSIEPNLLHKEVIDLVANSSKFVPHFHIPLQSGNNELLASMKRRYRRELYQERVDYIKKLMPNCCIGVDVIVGFPGETEEHFMDTYNFLNELDISYLHVFTYSERVNTAAPDLKGTVDQKTRNNRSQRLRMLSDKKKRFFYQSQIGKTSFALFEQEENNGMMLGFTENYVRIELPYNEQYINQICKVKLLDTNDQSGNVSVELVTAEVSIS
ncbi:MAG: tRNA (N(6)-L-threonylcarbamoyladenosine(37)-C(2))-methylthiotransferase MtaB [Cyclobacteriaceae bacterium]